MAISVGFTSASKRENSTLQLQMTETHDCTFKNGCSMLNPTLLLELNTATFPTYTAFKIDNRYYNVRDIRSIRNNLFEITGEVDVLATYRANIIATTAYVIYDTVPNSELVDNRLPMKTSKSVSASMAACPLIPDGGCYILSLTGSNDSTGIYKVSLGELRALIDDVSDVMNNIFDYDQDPARPSYPSPPAAAQTTMQALVDTFEYFCDSFKLTIDYIIEWTKWWADAIRLPFSQFFGSGNIPENIRECRYIPFNRGTTYGQNLVYLGTFKTRQSLSKLQTDTIVASTSVSIPWQVSDYRRRSPYTEIYIYLPYIGMEKLSSENLVGQSSINVDYTLGMRDGSLICTLTSGSEILGQYSCNVGASVPIGISNINIPRAATSLIMGAVSAAHKNLGGIGMAAINFGDSVTPNFSSIGGLDGVAATATNQNITCYTVFHDTNVAPNSEIATIGAPTFAPKSLATLTGYVQTMSASVAGAMTADERNKINNLLDNGIYIE